MKRFVFYCNNLPDMSAVSISHLNSNTYQQHFNHTHTHTLYHLFESLPVISSQSNEIRSMAEIDAVSMATISVFRSGQGVMVTRRAPPTRHLQPKSRQLSSCTNITETRSVCVRVCVLVSNWQNLLSIMKQEGWSHLTSPAWLTGPGDQSHSQTGFRPPGEQLSLPPVVSRWTPASQTIFSLYFFNRG